MFHRIIEEDLENIYKRAINWDVFEGKTVLVTGAYGMLATYIVYFLIYLRREKGINVTVIAQGRSKNNAYKRFGDYWEADGFAFTDVSIMEDISKLGFIDYIIHAAGLSNPRTYSTNPVEVIEPNAIGTYNLLKHAAIKGCEGFLFFSTGDVYGNIKSSEPYSEDEMGALDPLDSHSCYGESKRMGETLCRSFYTEYGVKTCIARIAHTYGPTMDVDNDPRVFSSFVRCILNNQPIEMYSDGRAKRPFCYVADAVHAFFLMLINGNGGEAYNISNTDEFLSIGELADILSTIPKNKVDVVYKLRSSEDTYMEATVNQGCLPASDKIRELGWKCEYSTLDGFKRVYEYLKDNNNTNK